MNRSLFYPEQLLIMTTIIRVVHSSSSRLLLNLYVHVHIHTFACNELICVHLAPYGPRGSSGPWFIPWFRRYINCVFVCLFVYFLSFLPCLLTSYLILSSLHIYFLTRLLLDLSISLFQNRPIPFPGQRSQEATKPGFSFFGFILCCAIFCCGCVFALVVFVLVFH